MIRPGSWCDVFNWPDRSVGWARVDNRRVLFGDPRGGPEFGIAANVDMLYLRAAAEPGLRLCAIGVHRGDDHAYAVTSDAHVVDLGHCATPFGVEIEAHETAGWWAYVQDSAASYEVVYVAPDGRTGTRTLFRIAPTSQGFLDVVNGTIITSDEGRVGPGDLILPNGIDGLVVGQLRENGIAVFDERTGVRQTLFRGLAPTPPHIAQTPEGAVYVCCWRADGSWVERVTRPLVPDVVTPPEDPMQEPGVTIDHFDPVLQAGQPWRVRWHDRNNPGFSGELEIVNGSVHVRLTNPVDTDRSGNRRPVEVRCA